MSSYKHGLYINPDTKEMVIFKGRDTDPRSVVTFNCYIEEMVNNGFEFLCDVTGPATTFEVEDGYKFVNYDTYTERLKVEPKEKIDRVIEYLEAAELIAKKLKDEIEEEF